MAKDFFLNRILFWSFWANVIFLLGMVGYLIRDTQDLIYPRAIGSSLTNIIYVILASAFVADSTLQVVVICSTNSNTDRYIAMAISCFFDNIGSHAYLLGALLAATAFASTNTVWQFNTIGVCGFVLGAAMNMVVSGRPTILYTWANTFNLLGSLLYLLATIINRVPTTQMIAISGDVVYVIDAILYMICWQYDRQEAEKRNEQIALLHEPFKISPSNSETDLKK